MRFQARVRTTHVVEFDHDVPELAAGGGNQDQVLEARTGAAHAAEAAAAAAGADLTVLEVLVEEVTEAPA